jgi:hypothetical protein
MQVSKILVALTVAAGFASASFAQGTATPATTPAPAAKVTAPAPAAAEKKVEAPKAAEPVKVEAKVEAAKPVEKSGEHHKHGHKTVKKETKPAPATSAAPVTK